MRSGRRAVCASTTMPPSLPAARSQPATSRTLEFATSCARWRSRDRADIPAQRSRIAASRRRTSVTIALSRNLGVYRRSCPVAPHLALRWEGRQPMKDRDSSRTPTLRDSERDSATPPAWVADSRAYGPSAPLTPTLSADLTEALVALWLEYAGVSPTDAHTHINGNTVTCVMVDGVSDFNLATDRTLEG